MGELSVPPPSDEDMALDLQQDYPQWRDNPGVTRRDAWIRRAVHAEAEVARLRARITLLERVVEEAKIAVEAVPYLGRLRVALTALDAVPHA